MKKSKLKDEQVDSHASSRDAKRMKKKRTLDNRKSVRLISQLGRKNG